MLESAQPVIEFETKQEGVTHQLRLFRSSDNMEIQSNFWLQSKELEDWLGVVEGMGVILEAAWKLPTQVVFRKRLREVIEGAHLARALEWQETGKTWLLLWRGDRQAWMNPQNHEVVTFQSRSDWWQGPFWTQSNAWYRQGFAQEWQDPNSDARRALAFLEAGEEERKHQSINWTHGNWEEIECIVRAAMVVEFDARYVLQQYPHNIEGVSGWKYRPPASSRLDKLLEVVDERNVRDEQLKRVVQHYDFNLDLTDTDLTRDKAILRIAISTPSMHDKMEARHFLLGWLREHAPQLLPDWV